MNYASVKYLRTGTNAIQSAMTKTHYTTNPPCGAGKLSSSCRSKTISSVNNCDAVTCKSCQRLMRTANRLLGVLNCSNFLDIPFKLDTIKKNTIKKNTTKRKYKRRSAAA